MNETSSFNACARPHLILIGGGSAAGKTMLAEMIRENFAGNDVTILSQDNYYKDLSHLPEEEIKSYNFDHPNAIDHSELIRDIRSFLANRETAVPQYDFITHARKRDHLLKRPTEIIILEGIFALHYDQLADIADLRIFVDTDEDIRLIRRLKRDTNERGFTMNSVLEQYMNTVKPMHHSFVEPTKRNADIIILATNPSAKLLKCSKDTF